ncbi:ribonuclease hi [Plakobranchus ocellatus]|uniref:Ribonuclease hi n=1 Tax=Plakobranchus ocellatus TaxID=259542 RepID=A0AAV4DL27_9GAST|nr:ribonuclease hi [Plakobranchus ocellatus]
MFGSGSWVAQNEQHFRTPRVGPGEELARGAVSVASKRKAEDLPTLMSVSPFAGWSKHYSKNFQQTKQRAEKQNLNFASENNEPYNNPFIMAELKSSVNKSNESAAGPDGVYYQFLRHHPESCLHTLLKLFNTIWTTGDIPPPILEGGFGGSNSKTWEGSF